MLPGLYISIICSLHINLSLHITSITVVSVCSPFVFNISGMTCTPQAGGGYATGAGGMSASRLRSPRHRRRLARRQRSDGGGMPLQSSVVWHLVSFACQWLYSIV